MTVASAGEREAVDWNALEQRLDALFTPSCDPYRVGAAVLFDKSPDVITQDERDIVKYVFMRMAARRGLSERSENEQTLRRASEMFHEIVSTFSSEDLLAGCRNTVVVEKLKENLRTRDQIRRIAADGFELCVRSLAAMGASGVTIHECGEQAFGETPWNEDRGTRP